MNDHNKLSKRDFLRKSVLTTAGAVGATTLATPYVRAQSPIKWRLQTYAGPSLAEHVVKPAIDAFNKAATARACGIFQGKTHGAKPSIITMTIPE